VISVPIYLYELPGLRRPLAGAAFQEKHALLPGEEIALRIDQQPADVLQIAVPCGQASGLKRKGLPFLIHESQRRPSFQITIGKRYAEGHRPPFVAGSFRPSHKQSDSLCHVFSWGAGLTLPFESL
jgi:hypothetical protein